MGLGVRFKAWLGAGGFRTRLGALASAIAALVLAVVASGRGCGQGPAPEDAARAFVAAARAGDAPGVYALLGPATRARLDADARAAQAKAGGRREFDPRELIDVTEDASAPARLEVKVRERAGDRAIVDVTHPSGAHDALTLVREAGVWRIELD